MKTILYLLIAFSIAGCAPTVWMHREHSNHSVFEKDQRECHYDSVKYGQSSNYYQTSTVAAIADNMRKNKVFTECMKARGYYIADTETAKRVRQEQEK